MASNHEASKQSKAKSGKTLEEGENLSSQTLYPHRKKIQKNKDLPGARNASLREKVAKFRKRRR